MFPMTIVTVWRLNIVHDDPFEYMDGVYGPFSDAASAMHWIEVSQGKMDPETKANIHFEVDTLKAAGNSL